MCSFKIPKISTACALCLLASLSVPLHAEDKGWFLGLNIGGFFSTNAAYQGGGNTANMANVMLGTGISVGGRLGYQAFFTKESGVRFYISGMGNFGIYPDTANINTADIPLIIDTYILADINADYLFNWTNKSNYNVGMFVGFFSGTLTGLPTKNPNPLASYSLGITAGANIGIRAVMNYRHQVEFGVKTGAALFLGSLFGNNAATNFTNLGILTSINAGYIYKF